MMDWTSGRSSSITAISGVFDLLKAFGGHSALVYNSLVHTSTVARMGSMIPWYGIYQQRSHFPRLNPHRPATRLGRSHPNHRCCGMTDQRPRPLQVCSLEVLSHQFLTLPPQSL